MAKPTSFYIDPTKRTEQMEEYGIRTLPEYTGSEYNLRSVIEHPDLRQSTTDYKKAHNLYSLLMGGYGTGDEDSGGGGGGGGGDGGGGYERDEGGTGAGEFNIPDTTTRDQLIDEGIQAAEDDRGSDMLDTFPDYSDVRDVGNPFGYGMQTGPGSSNPRAPGQDVVTNTGTVNLTGPVPGISNPRVSRVVSDALAQTPPGGGDPNMFYDAPVNLIERDHTGHPMAKGKNIVDFSTLSDTGAIQPTIFPEQVDFDQGFIEAGDFSAPGTLADPREKVSGADAANPKNFLEKLGLDQFNFPEAILKTAFNVAIGKPVTVFIDVLKALAGPADPRRVALNELYPDRTSTGTISSGLMTGYNPTSGGFLNMITGGRYGEEAQFGMQEAYQDRIDRIEKTLRNKGLSDAEIADVYAGSYKGDVSTDLFQRLNDLKEAKEKEKSRLDLFSGDVDERDQLLEDLMAQDKATTEGDAKRLADLTGEVDFGMDEAPGVDAFGLMGTEYETPWGGTAPIEDIKIEALKGRHPKAPGQDDVIRGEKVPLGPIDPGVEHPFITGKEEALANKMKASESSNNYKVVNDQGYMGAYQFGDDRLEDYKDETGDNFTRSEFLNSPKKQDEVFNWHVGHIKNYITKNNLDKAIGTEIMGVPVTMDGLISVAHLGGEYGMKNFVETGGKYNPSDDPKGNQGTTLLEYLEKFSTAAESETVDSDYLEYMEKTEEAIAREEDERAAIDRENARVAEAKAIADAAAEKESQYREAQERMNRRGDRDVPSPPTNVGNPFGYYAGGRVGYSKGGIVDLLK